MRVSDVFKWMLWIVLAVVLIAGAGGIWLWQNSDSLLRGKILHTFDKAAPELELHFDSLQLLSTSSARLTGVELRDRSTNRPVLRAKSVQAEVDEPLLMERQQVLVRSLTLSGIDILLKRGADGRWNWQDYTFHRITDCPFIPPIVTLTEVRAQVLLEHGSGIPPASLIVSTPCLQAVPSSSTGYDFAGVLTLPGAGDLALDGDCDLIARTWKLGGRLNGLRADQTLVDLAASTAPQLTEKLNQLDETINRAMPKTGEIKTADIADQTDASTASTSDSDRSANSAAIILGRGGLSPRFTGLLDVDFQLAKRADQPVPDLQLKIDLRDGQLSSSAVPVRLTDVQAKFFWNNKHVIVELLNARDGATSLTGDLNITLGPDAPTPTASLHLQQFPVSMDWKPLLPMKIQRFFDQFQPLGTVTGDIRLERTAAGKWIPVSVVGTADNASLLFHRFRQPVTGIQAKLEQRAITTSDTVLADCVFDVSATGRMNGRPVTTVGWLKNLGPEIELRFDVNVDDLPIDSNFRDALDEQGRKVVEALGINGVATADVECYRQPGLDKPTDIILKAQVHDSKMRFKGFPYDIEQLSGQLEFKSREKHWTFTNLQGRHGLAELSANGTFRGLPAPGALDLTIRANRAQFSPELFHALNPPMRSIWTMLNPEGSVNLVSKIDWTAAPDQKASVALPEVVVTDATIYPKAFPYRMQINSARLSYDPNDPRSAGSQHCEIHEFKAQHDGSPIFATGLAEVRSDGEWRLHLNDVNATDLSPDEQLRTALPDSWRDTLSRVAQTGLVSVEASEVEFRGRTDGDAPPTAAWDMNLRLKDCAVNAGLDLQRVSGLVRAQGLWDGERLKNDGTIRLDQVEVLDMIVAGITGPYSMTEDELVLGSRDVILGTARPAEVSTEERIQGQAYGGTLEMDGIVNLTAGSNYRFFGELQNGLLERYAARHVPDQPNLRGVVNSWIFVYGDGDSADALKGSGQMLISPASLFEVPVVLEMMSALTQLGFAVADRTAFDYALMSFEVRNRAFLFDKIDLAGDKLALRGRGSVGFGGDVVLDFFSRPPDLRRQRNPLQGLTMALATQWVTVNVRGTVDRPQTNVGSRPQLDDSMRQFLSTFNPAPGAPVPGLVLPNFLGLPMAPQAMRP